MKKLSHKSGSRQVFYHCRTEKIPVKYTRSFLRLREKMKNRILKLLPALIAIIVAGVIFCYLHIPSSGPGIDIHEEETAGEEAEPAESTSVTEDENIWIYICGEVNNPGVYMLNKGSRVFEALEMAGGFTDNAAKNSVNLALLLKDGDQIIIPDISSPGAVCDGGSEDEGMININTASMEQLITLPGIGRAKAQAIIEYRELHPFSSADEIMNVSGIKGNSFEKIKDRITV